MKVQVGTKNLPILVTPRIGGIPVTVTQIKTVYSNAWVNDTDTPMTFHYSYSSAGGPESVNDYDAAKSTDQVIEFDSPDTLYAAEATYIVMFFWTVKDTLGDILEQIYIIQPITLEILDMLKSK